MADDFYAAGCVLGKPVARASAPDLLEVVGRASINGAEVSRGTGADVLGHPHNPLAWLANHLAADGRGLRAGPDRADRQSGEGPIWLAAGRPGTMDLSGLGHGAGHVRLNDHVRKLALFRRLFPDVNNSSPDINGNRIRKSDTAWFKNKLTMIRLAFC